MSGPGKRTRTDVEHELKSIRSLYKEGKITLPSYEYLTRKLMEELKGYHRE